MLQFLGDSKSRRASNCTTGSRDTAILMNGLILPSGGASAVEGLRLLGVPRLVLSSFEIKKNSSQARFVHF